MTPRRAPVFLPVALALGTAAGCEGVNTPPTITHISAASEEVRFQESVALHAEAEDPDGDTLQYVWTATACTIVGSGPEVSFDALGNDDEPCHAGEALVELTVSDGRGGEDTARLYIDVEF